MTTISELAGKLTKAPYRAQAATEAEHLRLLAETWAVHVGVVANGRVQDCGHTPEPPYIVVNNWDDMSWCAECVTQVLAKPEPCPRDAEHGTTVAHMFPFGDILVAARFCPECGSPE